MLRECAESISRIKLPLRAYFLQKVSKKNFSRRSGHDFYPPPLKGKKRELVSEPSIENYHSVVNRDRHLFSYFKNEEKIFRKIARLQCIRNYYFDTKQCVS